MNKTISNKEAFVFYESMYKQLMILYKRGKLKEYVELSIAIQEYGLYGVIPDEDSDVWLYGFEQAATNISVAKDRYETAKENGSKGGRPVKYHMMDMVELRKQGLTNEQIAKTMDCSLRLVNDKLNRYDKANPSDTEYEQWKKPEITGKNLKEKETNNETETDTVDEKEIGFYADAQKLPATGVSPLAVDQNYNNPIVNDNKLSF